MRDRNHRLQPHSGRARVSGWHFLVGLIVLGALVVSTAGHSSPPFRTHGQASGDVTDTSAIIWTRVNREALVSVEVALDPSFTDSRTTSPVMAELATDFTVNIALTDLEPHRRYYYRICTRDPLAISEALRGSPGTFVTAPAPDDPASFTFVVSGDSWARFQPFRVFAAMGEMEPDFFLYLGDTIYADLSLPPARTLNQYRRAYKVNRRDASLQWLLNLTSVYAIWDDHEVENNFDRTHPRIPIGRQAFLEYWPIRRNAEDPRRLYRSFRWGQAAELFILDTRQYRDPSREPDTSQKTMLGAEQKAWLKAALRQSTATFKFIATSVPLRFHGRDSWEGYTTERQELFDFIQQNDIRNVIFLAADVHYAAVINHPEGFKEIIVGPIGQLLSKRQPAAGHPETEFSSNEAFNYGLIEVRADEQPPRVTIAILDEVNNILHTTEVIAEEMDH